MVHFINSKGTIRRFIIGMVSMEIACLLPVDRQILPQDFTSKTFSTLLLCQKIKEDFNSCVLDRKN